MKIKAFNIVKLYANDDDKDYYLLEADFNDRIVRTNCGDGYYDFGINFDDFIKFAKYIEDREKGLNDNSDNR